jgi:hypothetical protein
VSRVLLVAHLVLVATWFGSMAYSLGVVQPRVAKFFPDERRREDFLLVLAHGNRWRVVGLLVIITATCVAVVITAPARKTAVGYAASLVLYVAAGGVFAHVSWRHWPARVFALPAELAGFRRRLHVQAGAMLALVGSAFVVALSVSVR